MEIKLARHAGFCFGVKRAIDMALEAGQASSQAIYTLGPLIHNPQVVEELKSEGIEAVDDWENIPGGTLIIRSHGVNPQIPIEAAKKGLQLVDATCPFVKKAQLQAKKFTDEGYQTIVVGDKKHPEVVGIVGWTDGKAIVVENPQEAAELEHFPRVGVIAQTTQPQANLDAVVEVLQGKGGEVKVFNTICHATRERQQSAFELAASSDLMLVVGGTNSANTRKLAGLCEGTGTQTHLIETARELKPEWFAGKAKIGITAGASTPDWIIEEVVNKVKEMENQNLGEQEHIESMEELLDMKAIKSGEIVKGTVAKVTQDEVFVDIGGKSEGCVPLRELSNTQESPIGKFQPGDEIEVLILKVEDSEGRPLLSKIKADAYKAWDGIVEAHEQNKTVEGKVIEVVKGGILLDMGVRAFMPASLVQLDYVKDLDQYVGQTLQAKIIELDHKHKRVVLSRKPILAEDQAGKRAATLNDLQEGQVRKGIVRRLTNFGAFVDLGGIDGLIHVSELAWYRVKDPAEIVKVGDEVEVFVLGVDQKTQKISLSLKKVQANPWTSAVENYAVGSTVTAKVARIAPFGAFLELEPGIDGLVHISQLSEKRVTKVDEVVTVGQEVQAKVLDVDTENKKISLSIKALHDDGEAAEVQNFLDKQANEGATIGEAFPELAKEDE